MGKEFTFLMPCLNEEKTLGLCIEEIQNYIDEHSLEAEILVADNGSTDRSVEIAQQLGARVIHVEQKGYGYALQAGMKAAKGLYVVMGDCDCSYDFSAVDGFVEKLRQGYGLVMGDRFAGGIEKGAMPFSHKYIGVPFLSWVGRKKYHTDIHDFHCGIRGFHRKTALSLDFTCGGMEFATEMIGKFVEGGYRICQVPVPLRKDKREGKGHLRSIPDGMRHLRYMLSLGRWEYVIIFALTLAVLAGLLIATTLIPKSNIKKNMVKTADYLYEKEQLFEQMAAGIDGSKQDRYADAILAEIAYHYTSEAPVTSVMESKFSFDMFEDQNVSFYNAIIEGKEPNQQYLRYWHGSIVFLRPLLAVFDLDQIYMWHTVVLGLLALVNVMYLIKKKQIRLLIAFVLSLIAVGCWYVPFSLEYTWMFLLLMLCIIPVCTRAKNLDIGGLKRLFLFIGMCTSFLDFLTTETVTLLVPLMMSLWILAESKYERLIAYSMKISLLWAIGYIGMWVSKWILASMTLHINAMDYVRGNIEERLGGDIGVSYFKYLGGALSRNMKCLFPFEYGTLGLVAGILIFALLMIRVVLVFKKEVFGKKENNQQKTLYWLLIIIAIIPYVRYLVLHNHAYIHYFFTYRAQMTTVFALVMIGVSNQGKKSLLSK